MKKTKNKLGITIVLTVIAILSAVSITGCAQFRNAVNDVQLELAGGSFNIEFYNNHGQNTMNLSGDKINLKSNSIYRTEYVDGKLKQVRDISDVVTINIDGNEVENCGDTAVFAEKGLKKDVDFENPKEIKSTSDGSLEDNTSIAYVLNRYKNNIGKSRVVVIKSQLGDPICAYSGSEVYYEVQSNLPKTTKLMIDGKALYINRANFQIIDKSLL